MRSWIDFLACSGLALSLPTETGGPELPDLAHPDVAHACAVSSAVAQEPEAASATDDEKSPRNATELFAAFADVEGLEVAFTEAKHNPFLVAPLKFEGRIFYLRGGWLARVVDKPSASTVTITPDELRVTQGESTEVVDLRSNRDLRLYVRSLARVWSGNEPELRKSFEIEFELAEDPRSWTLTLTPKSERLRELMKFLRLDGHGYGVREIEIASPGGERVVTTVQTANAKRVFTDEEKMRWFGIEPD